MEMLGAGEGGTEILLLIVTGIVLINSAAFQYTKLREKDFPDLLSRIFKFKFIPSTQVISSSSK